MNLLENMLRMAQVYDYFHMLVPVALFDTHSWNETGNEYHADATLSISGIVIDVERAVATSSLAFVLAHEFGHIVQGMRDEEFNEKQADEIGLEIFRDAMAVHGLKIEVRKDNERKTESNEKLKDK